MEMATTNNLNIKVMTSKITRNSMHKSRELTNYHSIMMIVLLLNLCLVVENQELQKQGLKIKNIIQKLNNQKMCVCLLKTTVLSLQICRWTTANHPTKKKTVPTVRQRKAVGPLKNIKDSWIHLDFMAKIGIESRNILELDLLPRSGRMLKNS